jgi:hypothetical protein
MMIFNYKWIQRPFSHLIHRSEQWPAGCTFLLYDLLRCRIVAVLAIVFLCNHDDRSVRVGTQELLDVGRHKAHQ